jgi:surfeit locus 1 family protein
MTSAPTKGAASGAANGMVSRGAGLRNGVLVPSLAAAAALTVLVSLGLWQLDRLAWKEGLIATLEQRLSAPPVALPTPAEWPRLTAARDEFLRVSLRAEFLNDREALVYTGGSSMREATGGPGYWVFTPTRLADGALVMVNRGFVPEGRQDPASRAAGQTASPVDLVGVLRWPEVPGLFTPNGDPGRNIWFARDSTAMAAAKDISTAPFYVELESPEPPGGLPHAGRLQPNLPNNHFGYALTWLGLAVVLIGVYTAWLFSGWRKQGQAAASP